MRATVTALTTAPVKGLRVADADGARARPDGRAGRPPLLPRRRARLDGQRQARRRAAARSWRVYEAGERTLSLTFPGGEVVARRRSSSATEIDTRFFSRPARARPLLGPWSAALSEQSARPLRIVEGVGRAGVDRGRAGAVSLISRASLDGPRAGRRQPNVVDARRFRMLVEIDGVGAHEEDGWIGERVRIGARARALGRPRRALPRSPAAIPTAASSTCRRSTCCAPTAAASTRPSRWRSASTARCSSAGAVALGDAVELA